ncbi:hypothetical protein EI555_012772, partial [Monodon monoceros]
MHPGGPDRGGPAEPSMGVQGRSLGFPRSLPASVHSAGCGAPSGRHATDFSFLELLPLAGPSPAGFSTGSRSPTREVAARRGALQGRRQRPCGHMVLPAAGTGPAG